MIKDCKKAGNPLPKYEEIGGSFSVTLPLKEPIHSVKIPRLDFNNLTPRQQEIIKALQQGSLKTNQIIEKINISVTNRMIQLELAKLKKMGLIKSEGKTKTTIWFLIAK